jgi:RHS repeat-associated protein
MLGDYDETTWEFDSPSGLMKKKTDAAGKSVEYGYNARGQVAWRKSSRTILVDGQVVPVTATYAYFGDTVGEPATGELRSTTYNDGTPGVTYTYTRSGQHDSVTDAAGLHDFQYDNTKPWRLVREAFDSFYGGRILTRTYDSGTSTAAGTLDPHTLATVLGRTRGWQLGTTAVPAAELETSFPTTDSGRVAGVLSAHNNGASSRTFVYGYEPNSALLKSLAIAGNHPFTISRVFDGSRDLITSIETRWSSNLRTGYAYTYDDRHQRSTVVQSGDVFNDYGGTDGTAAGGTHQKFTYNGRGELTAAVAYLGENASDETKPLSARRHEFEYDGIGNRKSANTSGIAALRNDYSTNALNQYTSRENNTLALGGTVAHDSTPDDGDGINVAVADQQPKLAGRKGRHWGDNVVLENSVAPFQGALTVFALNPSTNQIQTRSHQVFIAPATQVFTYDADGNLTSDGVWVYSWDAENRLWAMETCANAVAGGVTARRLEFKYDASHRRVQKAVFNWIGSAWTVDTTASRRFLYEGWNLIAEFSLDATLTTLSLIRSYTWGLDIARSLADAGGVGALLQIRDHYLGKDYFPSYDGNGNIAALFDADTAQSGACVAAYEYSPYGEIFRCEGTYAKPNPFRFSTKFTDDDTGLVYYGRRYYSPSQGRFLGRDPKQELGGLNLYGFCRNNSINLWDVMGLSPSGPANPGDTQTEVVVIDGVVYNRTYSVIGNGNEGDEYRWDDGNDEAIGTIGPDGVIDFGTRGMPEDGANGQFIDNGIILPIAAVATARRTPQRTATITLVVGFDSSVTDVNSARASIGAERATLQQILDANGLGYIRVDVVYSDASIAAPANGRYNFTLGPAGYQNANATAAFEAVTQNTTGIAVLVTGGTITTPQQPNGGYNGFNPNNRPAMVIETAGFGTPNSLTTIAHELGHVGRYQRPGPRGPDMGHSLARGNIMSRGGGMTVDPNYISAIARLAIPIPGQ